VIPDDVKELVMPTLAHRLIVKPESALRGRTASGALQAILDETPLAIGEL